jgi:competence protein ComEC
MPLLLARFHAVSWTAPFANLVAVPVSGLLLTAAWIGVVADLAWPGAGRVWFESATLLAAALRAITERAGAMPGALLGAGSGGLAAGLAGAGALLLCAAAPAPRTLAARARPGSPLRSAALAVGGSCIALAAIVVAAAPELRPPPGRVWLVALDIGQGDALALGFHDGWWLVDAGPRSPRHDAGESVVLPFLRWAAVRRLETLVLTHDDGDHTGGAAAVLRGVGARRVVAPPALPGVPGPRVRFGAGAAAAGDRLRESPVVRVLWPPRTERPLPLAADNAASLVLEVGEGGARTLLLADVDSTVERRLIPSGPVGVLKVAHHGSASSTAASWLARTRPRIAIVSCGRRNPFGHPAPGVLARLAAAGAAVRRTDREGAIWLELEGDAVRSVDWRRGAPARRGSEPPAPLGHAAARHP